MRKLLVVIDMQHDFIDGSLGTKEAVAIVPNVIEKIKKYDIKDVFATRDTHQPNYMQTKEGKNLPVEHCIINTHGWNIEEKIAELLKDATIIDKPTFGSTELASRIKEIADKEEIEIELVGLCTDICVASNALILKAFMPEVNISIDPDCCAGVTPEKHLAAIKTMESCQISVA
ncbi:cysteine hydrolase family protein [Butyrivibrio sp. LC3010]|uniref:cysteine hydrolase family protein n=1 Tax=Butyrivibrio sp. LC3010 TaxID=1280680 RepID=UPI00041E3D30|nr:isochorismatase family cysteine hydrolase [Butyrivibrio sp. LC3010]